MAEKRYYWFKLEEKWFDRKEIKKLRRNAGGDTYTIIYLKMLLKSLQDGGKLYFEDFGESFAEEIALEIDEETENVKMTLIYLESHGLIVCNTPEEYELTSVKQLVGAETASAERQRRRREALKRDNVTQKRDEVTTVSRLGHTDKDIEIDKELDKDVDVVNTNDHNGDNSSFFDNLQKYLGRGLTFPESEQARAWREEQSEQMILKAVSIAALNRTTSFAYIDKIIRNWNNQGITTLAELQAHEEKREQAKGKQTTYSKNVKSAPEWSNPNPKVEMANPDEVKEIFDKYGIGNT
ncbi:phage replisome organizer N-terminal domain-containing protein [Lactococcus petauri]|uniref:phage replisome organizer N-terminal domain-containing protein n=1 Tax=Lactococcus petauri TaxID=1940789 RepID=UPI0024358D67|nr:phage replisome organizer N-terminal domain-containing protein [Lactococcus petauri]MDG6136542.1 phage replisome organizer N-terminal domain-containing protein [Lactococcus petauri]